MAVGADAAGGGQGAGAAVEEVQAPTPLEGFASLEEAEAAVSLWRKLW